MIQTTVMKGDSEVVHYDCPGVPLYIRTARLSSYPDGRALCHWHDDLEWVHILQGTMNYYINGQRIVLRAGDSLMVTPRQMHYGYSVRRDEDCLFICILLHPDLITQNRILSRKYLQPLLRHCPSDYLHVSSGTADGYEFAHILKTVAALHSEQAPGWELRAIGRLVCLFADTRQLLARQLPLSPPTNPEIYWPRRTWFPIFTAITRKNLRWTTSLPPEMCAEANAARFSAAICSRPPSRFSTPTDCRSATTCCAAPPTASLRLLSPVAFII